MTRLESLRIVFGGITAPYVLCLSETMANLKLKTPVFMNFLMDRLAVYLGMGLKRVIDIRNFGRARIRSVQTRDKVSSYTSMGTRSSSAKFVAWLPLAILAALAFLFAESWIVVIVALLGFAKGFLALLAICTTISFAIVYFYNYKETRNGVSRVAQKVRNWVARKEDALSPLTLRLVATSKLLGFVFSTLVAGPFLTTVVIGVLGFKNFSAYILVFLSSLLFSLVWAGVYSGAIHTIKELLVLL